jgi:small-conductance mechanosensitive channel
MRKWIFQLPNHLFRIAGVACSVKNGIIVLTLGLLVLLLTACGGAPATPQITPTETVTSHLGEAGPTAAPLSQEDLAKNVVVTPTPAPTATPGVLDEAVADISKVTGLNRQILLGLTGEDWLNLLVSLLIALLGIFIIVRLIYMVIEKIIKRTASPYDDQVLDAVGAVVRWFLAVLIVEFATDRLPFMPAEWKQELNQFYSVLYIILLAIALWRIVDLSVEWYLERHVDEEDGGRYRGFLPAFQRSARVLLLILAVSGIFGIYGVNLTYLVALLGIGGLALSLAAQDTISDAINGFLILLDRPFREGDRIRIQEMDTWGDVVEIGTRTTRIRTLDNRMVVVPNSKIGKNQVVNFSYPDPRYRIETEVSIAYGADLDQVREVLKGAVTGVEGVLPDKPVEALLVELGDSALKFRVRWWIESFTDTRYIYDLVHDAIYDALNAAGIESPFNTYDVNLRLSQDEVRKYMRDLKEDETE